MEPFQLVLSVVATILVIFAATYLIYYLRNIAGKPDEASEQAQKIASSIEKIKEYTDPYSNAELCKHFFNTDKYTAVELGYQHASLEYFMNQLVQYADDNTVEIYRKDFAGDSRKDVIITVKKDSARFLLVGSAMQMQDLKPENFKPSDSYNPLDWTVGNELAVLRSCAVITPIEECDEDCQITSFAELRKIWDQAKFIFKGITTSGPEETSIDVYALQDFGNGVVFSTIPTTMRNLSDGLLGDSYEKARISISGQLHAVPMNVTTEFIQDLIANHENVMILGRTGTGKTTLCGEIIQGLDESTAVVKLDFATLSQMQTPQGRSALTSLMKRLQNHNKTSVLYWVDEGQAIAASSPNITAALLELMEGASKNIGLPSATLIAINAVEEELDTALVSRCQFRITLLPLTRDMAAKLVSKIKHERPDEHFDSRQFDRSFLEKTPYSGENAITLREIWACFQPKTRVDKWKDTFREFKVSPPSVPVPQPKVSQPQPKRR